MPPAAQPIPDMATLLAMAAESAPKTGPQQKRGYKETARELQISDTMLRRIRKGQAELPKSCIPYLAEMTGVKREVIVYVMNRDALDPVADQRMADALGVTDAITPEANTRVVEDTTALPAGWQFVHHAYTKLKIGTFATYRQATEAARPQLVRMNCREVRLSRPALLSPGVFPFQCTQLDMGSSDPAVKSVPMNSTVTIKLLDNDEQGAVQNGTLVLVQFKTGDAHLQWYNEREDGEGNVVETFSSLDKNQRVHVVLYRKDLPSETLQSQRLIIGKALRIVNYALDTEY